MREHHTHEDRFLFPDLERLTGKPHIMDSEKRQHEELHDGLERMGNYIERTEKEAETYKWDGEGGLAPEFRQHLVDEVAMFLSLKDVDGDEISKIWKSLEDRVKQLKMDHIFVSVPTSVCA